MAAEMNPRGKEIAVEIDLTPTSTGLSSSEELNQKQTISIPFPPPPLLPKVVHNISRTTTSLSVQPPPNLPRGDLLANREDYFKVCVPLYKASIRGDWDTAKLILKNHPELKRFAITENFETALHVAASKEETKKTIRFVQKMVDWMTPMDLELQNKNSNTALCLASAAGNDKMVEIMVAKNRQLMIIPGNEGMTPLQMSALQGRHNTVRNLYSAFHRGYQIRAHLMDTKWDQMLLGCVECDLFVHRLIRMKGEPAEKDSDALNLLRKIWENFIRQSSWQLESLLRGPPDLLPLINGKRRYSSRILFVAEETGNTRFIIELLTVYPDLIRNVNDDKHTIFHTAVMHRHHEIYSLLYELDSRKDLIVGSKDEDGNNILHLVGKTSLEIRSQTSGAHLLMQRELLWFKEVEKMLPPRMRENKNKEGQTPYEIFSINNKDLVTQGLDWMKDCMVVTTLIVTVAFAVAFTVPGAYDQNNGFPIFLHDHSFLVFVIADAITLISSSTSLLVFLSILTSRHGQRDFMYSLPRKLMIGLLALLISVASMMVTFSASFFVLYRNSLKWVPILIAILSFMPVLTYVVLQFPLLWDMFRSMYDSRYLFKPRKHILYNTK